MATAVKRGGSYKITVSCGYDLNGKQIRKHMTWTPEPGMTERQEARELERQKILFEERIKHSTTYDPSIRFKDFSDIYLKDYAHPNLKAKTVYGYERNLKIINQALGHIKLSELKPGHIAVFYRNLQEEGMREREFATARTDFIKVMKENNITQAALAEKANVSTWVIAQLRKGKKVERSRGESVAEALGVDFNHLFATSKDMTPLSAGTIHVYHRTLSAVLGRAVKWGYLKSNPASNADLPSLANRKAAYLDEPDARKLLVLLREEPIKWRAIVTFTLLSGLRRGEVAGLRWSDVNFEDHTIQIEQTLNYLPGTGIYEDTPKTDTSSRPLRLSRSAFLLLQEYKVWQDEQQKAFGDAWVNKDERIFTRDDGGPLVPDTITKWFAEFIERSGLPKVSIHSLRHTYASLMINDGVPLVVVSKQLGHAQQSTTANIYTHVIASAEARAAQTFDKFDDIIIEEEKDDSVKTPEIRKIG